MIGSRKNKQSIITSAILLSLALFLTFYTSSAHLVASHVHQFNDIPHWPTPGYSFLPWPSSPTGIVILILVQLNTTDLQYYNYVIKSGVLIVATIIIWVFTIWKIKNLRQSMNSR